MRLLKLEKRNTQGFTAIELIIAAGVFSVVLMAALSSFLGVGRMFYKGVTINNTQNIAVQIANSITTDIQNATIVNAPGSYFCIGNVRYTASIGVVYTGSSGSSGLVRDVPAGGCSAAAPASSPKEFLTPNMRVSQLSVVSKTPTLFQVDVTVAYGDNEAFVDHTAAKPVCKSFQQSSQYCAVSSLSSIVSMKDFSI